MADIPQKLAVLIDADNTSPKHTQAIFDEIARLGEASVRRCYGDFSSPQMSGWSKVQAEFGLVPYHQPANTTGKNASDIALVIDAMDLMHSGRFDGFVLVSSDSDFTRLASRIREQALDVFGIGQMKTPDAFRKACKRFIYIENLSLDAEASAELHPDDKTAEATKGAEKKKADKARSLITKAMEAIEQEEEWYPLSTIGSRIVAAHPDFDTRTYGHKKLSDLVSSLKQFELRRGQGKPVSVRLKS